MCDSTEMFRVYSEAMNACLENAMQWLEDAKLLSVHGSSAHCRALQNFAGEELAKAVGCWLVVNKFLHNSHPLVKYNSGKGVFRDHDAKNLVVTVLGVFKTVIMLLEMQNQPINKEILEELLQDPVTDPIYLDIASRGEAKRLDWQYVDIYQKKDSLKVSNPLKIDTGDFLDSALRVKSVFTKLSATYPKDSWIEDLVKQSSLLTDKFKGGYDTLLYKIEFIKQLIHNPRSDIALLFQEEIKAKYKLYEINRKRIKKRRSQRKRD